MTPIPEVNALDVAFGNIGHLPRYGRLGDDYRRGTAPACRAVSEWFFTGGKSFTNGIEIAGKKWRAREGVDHRKALAAIQAALGSFQPKHEHKIAGCGFLLDEWFEQV